MNDPAKVEGDRLGKGRHCEKRQHVWPRLRFPLSSPKRGMIRGGREVFEHYTAGVGVALRESATIC